MQDIDYNQQTRHTITRLLARREHSYKELMQKLSAKEIPYAIAESELQKFVDKNIQSDERFAVVLTRSAYHKGKGPQYIMQQLQMHDIQSISFAELDTQEYDWFALAQQVRIKRFGQEIPDDWTLVQKQKRFLQTRGFTMAQIEAAF
ncbi:regulatory protein RecX [Glaciecola sp. 1036]|uniref:regulatory protein RecX n=1 Tax=Alteromonadaceae TaxID=72275 RepID=UPI003D042218